jgi:8-hydroxy-5-deazaflavin:NADPH oxidoreductase
MRIGIIGAGRIGHGLAVRFATVGHQVMVSNSRGPHTLTGVVASIQGLVCAGTVAEAAGFGEVVAVAIPLRAVGALPPEPLAGKVVVDATNYYPEVDGRIPELDADQTTSSELLAALLPNARVVKAFNTISWVRLLDDSHPELPAEQRLAILVASDDPDARRTVIDLIDQIGFTGVEAGTLAESRRQQPGSAVYDATLTAWQARALLSAWREGPAGHRPRLPA